MNANKKAIIKVASWVFIVFMVGLIMSFCLMPTVALAEESKDSNEIESITMEPVTFTDNGVVFDLTITGKERGSVAKYQYSISGKDSKITAKLYCSWSFGFPTVEVLITLFRADTETAVGEAVALNYTEDLNIFQSIEATANTNGDQWYWYGVVNVTLNDEVQPPYVGYHILFDGEGNRLS